MAAATRGEHRGFGWGKLLCRGGLSLFSLGTVWRLSDQVEGAAPTLIIIGAFVGLAAGTVYALRACVHRQIPDYQRRREVRRWQRREERLAAQTILLFSVVLVMSYMHVGDPAYLAVGSLIGAAIVAVRQFMIGGELADLERRFRIARGSTVVVRWPPVEKLIRIMRSTDVSWGLVKWLLHPQFEQGKLTVHLRRVLCLSGVSIALSATIPVAEAMNSAPVRTLMGHDADVPESTKDLESSAGGRPREDTTSADGSRAPTYAELCPGLADPSSIEHGLGDLFARHGAVQAGCGEPAVSVGRGVWVSRGMCGAELRSLAIAVPGRAVMLVYGRVAGLAWEQAQAHDLQFVEVQKVDGGEVAFIGATDGTYVALRRGATSGFATDAVPARCEDVPAVTGTHVVLDPVKVNAWQQFLAREGWAWPVEQDGPRGRQLVLKSGTTGKAVAVLSCRSLVACTVSSDAGQFEIVGRALVSATDLAAYMPQAP